MFKNLRNKLARFISSEYEDLIFLVEKNQKDVDNERKEIEKKSQQRVAEIISKMDLFEPLMKKFNGTFSVEYEHVEDALNEQGKIGMYMWAWQQKGDPHFQRMVSWIMDKSGNSLMKLGNPTELQVFYKRAEIANMILYRKEVGRLASNYEELLAKNKGEDFDPNVGVEE